MEGWNVGWLEDYRLKVLIYEFKIYDDIACCWSIALYNNKGACSLATVLLHIAITYYPLPITHLHLPA